MNELIDFATQYGTVQKRLLNEFEVPYAVMDATGKLLWMNRQFEALSEKNKGYHTFFPLHNKLQLILFLHQFSCDLWKNRRDGFVISFIFFR